MNPAQSFEHTRNRISTSRDSQFGLCKECLQVIPSKIVVEKNGVFLEKRCPEHGASRVLISSDAQYWETALRYNRPGTTPFKWSGTIKHGCPQDCGICPHHQQHTCIAIIEITKACNLACNVCFADTTNGNHLPYAQITRMIDGYVTNETDPEILQLSGGEPTLHPQLFEIIAYAQSLGINDVVVSTNGLRLLDEDFARKLAELHPTIYLQFDTFHPQASKQLRGQNLVKEKMRVVERCNQVGLTTVLVPTLVRGVNDNEIGDLIQFALRQEHVFGVNFQPITLTGRNSENPGNNHLTIPEVLTKVEAQSNGLLSSNDFRPIPCPHPHCTALTYVLVENDQVIPITQLVDVDEYIDYATNRALASPSILKAESFSKLYSTRAIPGTNANHQAFCDACGIQLPKFLNGQEFRKAVKIIGIHAFMDCYTYQLERAQKCCIHLLQPDGKMIPFCNYNLLHRRSSGV